MVVIGIPYYMNAVEYTEYKHSYNLFCSKHMSFLVQHLSYLEHRIRSIRHLPTAFEYYSAKHLTLYYGTPFHVYQDISPSLKMRYGFPERDQGVDVANEDFTHIGQAKYYGPGKLIHYGTLATFLATPLLVGRKELKLSLLRTRHSILHTDIKRIANRGVLNDISLDSTEFLQDARPSNNRAL